VRGANCGGRASNGQCSRGGRISAEKKTAGSEASPRKGNSEKEEPGRTLHGKMTTREGKSDNSGGKR